MDNMPAVATASAHSQQRPIETSTQDDPLDALLNLEDQYFTEGFVAGQQDGTQDGQTEGRVFGMQRGFERFSEMGYLHSQAAMWRSRTLKDGHEQNMQFANGPGSELSPIMARDGAEVLDVQLGERLKGAILQPLHFKGRLEKHVTKLYDLSEPSSLSLENNEKDVASFDDRLSVAQSTAEVIKRNLGTNATRASASHRQLETDIQNQERNSGAHKVVGDDIEDLAISRLVSKKSGGSQRRA